ncbi:hypothetical protein [Paraburkholderia ferrariae]|uniref:hypothetical protein n=1 Tax=Paraburkholderia ferrariae TaxID=386056 RepID=UPI0012EC4674|nr:hypothetical protein [Paraburkholderia ferrariae]
MSKGRWVATRRAGPRRWYFDRDTNRDEGLLVALHLGKQPFIDGTDGLFSAVEGPRAVEGRARDTAVIGLTYAALMGVPAVALGCADSPTDTMINVELTVIDVDREYQETIPVCCVVTEQDVRSHKDRITASLQDSVSTGVALLDRAGELFPRLRFGPKAVEQSWGPSPNPISMRWRGGS